MLLLCDPPGQHGEVFPVIQRKNLFVWPFGQLNAESIVRHTFGISTVDFSMESWQGVRHVGIVRKKGGVEELAYH